MATDTLTLNTASLAPTAYIMPKPECAPHLGLLEKSILDSGYSISGVYPVENWYKLSCDIYAPQIEASQSFKSGFETHAWALRHFYSNRALIMTIEKESASIDEKLAGAYNIKRTFRQRLLGAENGVAILMVNVQRLPALGIRGQKGTLGTYDDGTFTRFSDDYDGEWDYIYFKYAHCPDPNKECFLREWDLLTTSGILDPKKTISEAAWRSMKEQGTMVPPHGGGFS